MKASEILYEMPNEKKTITLELSGELANHLPKFIEEISKRAAQGHSFMVEADREDGEVFSVSIDGDGADRINIL